MKREVFADEMPVRVEYSLTDLGEKMKPIIQALADWGKVYKEEFQKVHKENE